LGSQPNWLTADTITMPSAVRLTKRTAMVDRSADAFREGVRRRAHLGAAHALACGLDDAHGSFGRLRLRHRSGCRLSAEDGEPTANDVECRREDQSERRNTDHAGETRGTERLPELGAGARRPYQRHDTENEGERRHQDRPQPQPRGFHGRGPAVTALVLELLGELDDQDRIL